MIRITSLLLSKIINLDLILSEIFFPISIAFKGTTISISTSSVTLSKIISLIKPPTTFQSLSNVFESLLEHELNVTESINNIVGLCLEEKDFTTHNFMQWYVSEQLEEEAMARTILDKLNMIGNDKAGLYLFDRDLNEFDPVENVV